MISIYSNWKSILQMIHQHGWLTEPIFNLFTWKSILKKMVYVHVPFKLGPHLVGSKQKPQGTNRSHISREKNRRTCLTLCLVLWGAQKSRGCWMLFIPSVFKKSSTFVENYMFCLAYKLWVLGKKWTASLAVGTKKNNLKIFCNSESRGEIAKPRVEDTELGRWIPIASIKNGIFTYMRHELVDSYGKCT